jgi:hypothetical protein
MAKPLFFFMLFDFVPGTVVCCKHVIQSWVNSNIKHLSTKS